MEKELCKQCKNGPQVNRLTNIDARSPTDLSYVSREFCLNKHNFEKKNYIESGHSSNGQHSFAHKLFISKWIRVSYDYYYYFIVYGFPCHLIGNTFRLNYGVATVRYGIHFHMGQIKIFPMLLAHTHFFLSSFQVSRSWSSFK